MSAVPTGSIFDLLGDTENEDPHEAIQAAVAAKMKGDAGASQAENGASSSGTVTKSDAKSSSSTAGQSSKAGQLKSSNQRGGQRETQGNDVTLGPEKKDIPNNKGENGRQGGRYSRSGNRSSKRNDKNVAEEKKEQRRENKYRDKDRQSASGKSYELKRGGGGRGNWGVEGEKDASPGPDAKQDANDKGEDVEGGENGAETEAEAPEVQMTLDEYYKVLEEKKKAVITAKSAGNSHQSAEEVAQREGLSALKKDDDEFSLGLTSVKQAKANKTKVKKDKELLPTFFTTDDQNAGRGSRGGDYADNRRSGEGRSRGRGGDNEGNGRRSRGGKDRGDRRQRGGRGGGRVYSPMIDDVQAFPSLAA